MREKTWPNGPWTVATGCSWRRILTESGEPVIVPTNHHIDGHPDLTGSREALTLAALSPDMLEALENIQTQIQQVNDGDRPYTGFDTELIDAVIAEAYGEKP